MRKLFYAILFTGVILSFESCGKSCPDGMVEKKLEDGTTICVPDNL